MPRQIYEIQINDETSEEDLHRCVVETTHTSDSNVSRVAAQAHAELARRERAEWRERFNAESRERVNAQQFQQGQMDKQLDVVNQQAKTARHAMRAAWAAAFAAIAIAIISAISLLLLNGAPN